MSDTGSTLPNDSRTSSKPGPIRAAFALTFAVILPLVSLSVELVRHLCLESLFDPIPTGFHALAVAFVPATGAYAWWAARFAGPTQQQRALWLLGPALAIAFFYTLVFLPLTPFAILGILFYGLGLLALSPLFALISLLRIGIDLRRRIGHANLFSRVRLGFALGLAAMIGSEVPGAVVFYGIQLAESVDETKRDEGIAWLRRLASERMLARALSLGPENLGVLSHFYAAGSPFSGGRFVDNSTRTLRGRMYYRVVGARVESAEPIDLVGSDGGDNLRTRRWRWDPDRGGTRVGAMIEGLSLDGSRQDLVVLVDEATAYLDWTMEFENHSPVEREARTLMALPPGAVISRATLWVKDEPREAAFGGKRHVREAYQAVVTRAQPRDPLLVTPSGFDQALIQCFPIPPLGKMKIRIGVSIPLELSPDGDLILRLPSLVERNFALNQARSHHVWIETTRPPVSLEGLELEAVAAEPGVSALRGQIGERELAAGRWTLRFDASTLKRNLIVSDPFSTQGQRINQILIHETLAAPSQLVVVIDASKAFEARLPAIADSLAALPASIPLVIVLAADEPVVMLEAEAPVQEREKAIEQLRTLSLRGGHGASRGLLRGLELAGPGEDHALLWLHGNQPFLLHETDGLEQWLERSRQSTRLISLQVGAGFHALVDRLAGELDRASIRIALEDDKSLQNAIARIAGQASQSRFERYALTRDTQALPPTATPAARDIARLWARGAVQDAMDQPGSDARKRATALAIRYRLVTPVSGAVVLETDAETEAAGLDIAESPVPEGLPGIPEPGTGVLLGVGLVAMAMHRRRLRSGSPVHRVASR